MGSWNRNPQTFLSIDYIACFLREEFHRNVYVTQTESMWVNIIMWRTCDCIIVCWHSPFSFTLIKHITTSSPLAYNSLHSNQRCSTPNEEDSTFTVPAQKFTTQFANHCGLMWLLLSHQDWPPHFWHCRLLSIINASLCAHVSPHPSWRIPSSTAQLLLSF